MSNLCYQTKDLMMEDVALSDIVSAYGTPTFVYSLDQIKKSFLAYKSAFGGRDHLICYAVKANSNLSILKVLSELGAGFDIVSEGEFYRVKKISDSFDNIVFSGVGKRYQEIVNTIEAGVGTINVESSSELQRVAGIAEKLQLCVPIALRVNPNVDPKTHPYVSTGLKENKFGISIDDAPFLYDEIASNKYLEAKGVACHIGSQLTDISPIEESVSQVISLLKKIESKGIKVAQVDCGGGLGIPYSNDEECPSPRVLVEMLVNKIPEEYKIVIEPGRSIVGSAGVLLTNIEYIKSVPSKNFVIVDAAMTELIRPALYRSSHKIIHLREKQLDEALQFEVVGPVCETGDWLGHGIKLEPEEGETLAICDAGAYGFTMASNYNSRVRAAEVLVEGDKFKLIRNRESFEQLVENEIHHVGKNK